MVFEELVKRLTPKLKRITCKLNGGFSSFSHEDLYQEALLHLWLDFKDEKLSNKTGSYILQGCYFYLKNYLRKVCNKVYTISLEQIRKGEDEDLDLGAVSSLEDPRSSLEVGHSKMLMEQIKNNGLTRREKEVFCLALEGLTTREIGDRLGISHVMVVKLKNRIKNKCRKYIDFV